MRFREAPIADLVLKCETWDPSGHGEGFFDYIDLSSVDKNSKSITAVTRIRCSEAPSRARQIVRQGDVLVATVRPNLNGVALVSADHDGMTASTGYCVLRSDPALLDPRYLFQWVRTPAFVRGMVRVATGANYPAVSDAKIKASVVPLPSLDEQRRIARILDAADTLRTRRRQYLARLEILLASAFNQIVSKCARPPISVGEPRYGDPSSFVELSSVARLATGHTPDRKIPEYWGGDIPWISLTDIRELDGEIAHKTIQNVTEDGIANSSSVLLPAGTVCLSRTASVGFVAVMGKQMATSQDFVNWICGDDLEPVYLMQALRTSRPYLLTKSRGSTHKTLYYRDAERFHVFLPPRQVQRRFVRVFDTAGAHRSHCRAHIDELDSLFASLQSRAFRGDL